MAAIADVLTERVPRWATAAMAATVLAYSVESAGDFPSGVVGGIVTLALGISLFPLRAALGPPLAAVAVAGSVLGIYLAVPDTEWIVVLAVLLAPLLLVHELAARPTPPSSAFALAALLVWTTADGARGRPGAAVGALACLVLLVGIAAAARLAQPASTSPTPRVLVVAAHAAAVLTCSRLAGLEEGIGAALVITLPVLVVVLVADTVLLTDRRARLG